MNLRTAHVSNTAGKRVINKMQENKTQQNHAKAQKINLILETLILQNVLNWEGTKITESMNVAKGLKVYISEFKSEYQQYEPKKLYGRRAHINVPPCSLKYFSRKQCFSEADNPSLNTVQNATKTLCL